MEPFVTMPADQLASVAMFIIIAVVCLTVITFWGIMFPDKPKRRK